MKKIISILLVISVLFAFASCKKSESGEDGTTEKVKTTETTEQTDETQEDWIPEPYSPPTKEIDKDSVYYNATQEDFRITYDGDSEVLQSVADFCTINYLGMGTTYREMGYTLRFMTLAQMPETSWRQIPAFLDTLTDVQLDYMSYRVFTCLNTAQKIIERDEILMEYVVGVTDDADTYSRCTNMQVFRLAQYLFNQFDERGVKYDWTVYDTEYLFVN